MSFAACTVAKWQGIGDANAPVPTASASGSTPGCDIYSNGSFSPIRESGREAITTNTDTTGGDRSFLGHPRGLAYIAFTEAWERFSFYGMQALLVLYMAGYLLHPGRIEGIAGFDVFRSALESLVGPLSVRALATQVFGLYIGLVYFTPVLGGLLGDRVLGRTRAVLGGALLMAVGHFMMAFEVTFLFALSALILGSGLLKGNLAAQVGGLYDARDKRRDGAFLIYNVAINVGAFVAPLVCGTLGELYGWHYGFGAAGVGMLVSIGVYLKGLRHLPVEPIAGRRSASRLAPRDVPVVASLLVLYVIATMFWIAQTQVWNSYPLWIEARVDRAIAGLTFPITWFQSIDMLAVLVCAPFVLRYWKKRVSVRTPNSEDLVKVAIGCALFAGACLLLTTAESISAGSPIPLIWPVVFHFICAVAFLNVGPVMMAMISRTAPASINAMMVGGYYLSIFAGGLLSGWLGRFYEQMTPAAFWMLHGAVAGAGTLFVVMLFKPLVHWMGDEGAGTRPAGDAAPPRARKRTAILPERLP